MSKLRIFVSATFVLFLGLSRAHASPQDSVPEFPETETPWPTTPLNPDLSVAKPPAFHGAPSPPNARYYPYQQQLTVRYGRASDLPKINVNDNVTGFQYLFPKFLSPKLEAGADLHDDGRGHIHAGARWIWHERSYFRPSLKIGFDHLINATENLATLTLIDNQFLRTTATLEWVIWNPYSLRWEAEALFGSKNTIGEMTLGLSRGW
jgi:hypothetical protein